MSTEKRGQIYSELSRTKNKPMKQQQNRRAKPKTKAEKLKKGGKKSSRRTAKISAAGE